MIKVFREKYEPPNSNYQELVTCVSVFKSVGRLLVCSPLLFVLPRSKPNVTAATL